MIYGGAGLLAVPLYSVMFMTFCSCILFFRELLFSTYISLFWSCGVGRFAPCSSQVPSICHEKAYRLKLFYFYKIYNCIIEIAGQNNRQRRTHHNADFGRCCRMLAPPCMHLATINCFHTFLVTDIEWRRNMSDSYLCISKCVSHAFMPNTPEPFIDRVFVPPRRLINCFKSVISLP
jgi:hypothetical protein